MTPLLLALLLIRHLVLDLITHLPTAIFGHAASTSSSRRRNHPIFKQPPPSALDLQSPSSSLPPPTPASSSFESLVKRPSTTNPYSAMGSLTRPARGKGGCMAGENGEKKAPGLFVTTREIGGDDTDFGLVDGRAEVVKATMAWWQTAMVMIAETISLGILALPSILAAIGFAPGLILILVLGLTATFTGDLIGKFKLAYPQVRNMADAGGVMWGPWGREFLGAAQILFQLFCMASHILTFGIMMNTITAHAACSVVFNIVGSVVCLVCTMPRKLESISWMAIVSFVSVFVAVMITMVRVGIERPGEGVVKAFVETQLHSGFLAVTNIIFAYAGHVAFFGFMSEMKRPQDYRKSLLLLQGVGTSTYLIVAIVIYRYAGEHVRSPALSSISPLFRKIAFGCACPTIVIGGVINGHVVTKFINVRLCGRPKLGNKPSVWASYFVWMVLAVLVWAAAWVIAEIIPHFNDLLGLISAAFASWFTYGLSGVFGLFLLKGRYMRNKKTKGLTAAYTGIVVLGVIICGMGLYASGTSIAAHAKEAGNINIFTCADNSLF